MLHGGQLPPSPAAQGSLCPCFLQVIAPPPSTLPTLLPRPFPLPFSQTPKVTSLAVSHKAHISLSIQFLKKLNSCGPLLLMLGSLTVKWSTCRICISVSMCVISQQRCPVVIYFIRQTLHGGDDTFTRILHLVFLETVH